MYLYPSWMYYTARLSFGGEVGSSSSLHCPDLRMIGAWWLWVFIAVVTPAIINIIWKRLLGGIPLGAEPPGTGPWDEVLYPARVGVRKYRLLRAYIEHKSINYYSIRMIAMSNFYAAQRRERAESGASTFPPSKHLYKQILLCPQLLL
jgi:amino acid transporter